MEGEKEMTIINKRKILILYASQTGTAQEIAEELEREAVNKYQYSTSIYSMDDYASVCSFIFKIINIMNKYNE